MPLVERGTDRVRSRPESLERDKSLLSMDKFVREEQITLPGLVIPLCWLCGLAIPLE